MALGSNWHGRALQQLVRYEALFKLLDEMQGLEDVAALAQPVARQWKYFASVTSWRLVVADGAAYTCIDASRGQAQVSALTALPAWDAHHWHLQRPHLHRPMQAVDGPTPPDFMTGGSVAEIMVLPIVRGDRCIALLSAAARHLPFDDLDTKFMRIFGHHYAERVHDVLFRARATRALQERATHDALTGLLNRGAILEQLQQRLAASHRNAQPLSVVLCDIDHFKRINDTWGHLTGDAVLTELARRLDAEVRVADSLGRYGGEEFLVVLQPCSPAEARLAAERFRRAVADAGFAGNVEGGPGMAVSISLGTASCSGQSDTRMVALLKQADTALYAAKAAGRNRAVAAEDLAGPGLPGGHGLPPGP